jgi:YHS domain-containing protein
MNSHHSPNLVIDPVCGMSLPLARAATSLQAEAGTVYFCSRGCRNRFQADPDRYPPAAAGRGLAGCDHGRALANGGLTAVGLPAGAGLAAASVLLAIYFSVLGLLSGWRFTLLQFEEFWPYIIALAVGFGIQVGLFLFLRRSVHAAHRTARVVAATGSSSGIAMLSCCTHYLVNLLPVLGATGLASLVGQYQVELFLVGLAANLAGIGYMASRIVAFSRATGSAGQAAVAALLVGVLGLGAWNGPARAGETALPPQESYEGRVMVEVTPLALAPDQPWQFEVQLNTHSVALDQDMAASAVLLTADGQEMQAEQWKGDPPGGHHRSGILLFTPPVPAPDTVILKIRGVAVDERVFTWRP